MLLKKIHSIRKISSPPSFKIVEDWEDILSQQMNLKLENDNKILHKIRWKLDRWKMSGLCDLFHLPSCTLGLRFDMDARNSNACIINKYTIPVIIDFWLGKDDLPDFYRAYKKCPLVLITSAEVYEFLKSNNCPLNIAHWPLSYPDHYKIETDENYKKTFDFCLIGRPAPFFVKMLKQYAEDHPDFEYIINNNNINNRRYYTNKGQYIMQDTGRQSYLEIIRRSKITCYTTPGLDEAKIIPNKYNQVTPRLFEMIAGGCYVIAHYPINADTKYYELDNIVAPVNNYPEFEKALNYFRAQPPRKIAECKSYLQKHYTSTRVNLLKHILDNQGIKY